MSIANFSRITVTGLTQEEALAKAPFIILGNASTAFNNWKAEQTKTITKMMENQFMLDYLERKTKFAPGLGFSILIEPPSGYMCHSPWVLKKVVGYKSRQRKKDLIDTIEVIGYERDGRRVLLGEVQGWRDEAMNIARQAYRTGFTGRVEARHIFTLPEGEHTVSFVGDYNPGRTATEGIWICFGIENKPLLTDDGTVYEKG